MLLEIIIIIGIIFAIFYFYGDLMLQKISGTIVSTAQKTTSTTIDTGISSIVNPFKTILKIP